MWVLSSWHPALQLLIASNNHVNPAKTLYTLRHRTAILLEQTHVSIHKGSLALAVAPGTRKESDAHAIWPAFRACARGWEEKSKNRKKSLLSNWQYDFSSYRLPRIHRVACKTQIHIIHQACESFNKFPRLVIGIPRITRSLRRPQHTHLSTYPDPWPHLIHRWTPHIRLISAQYTSRTA